MYSMGPRWDEAWGEASLTASSWRFGGRERRVPVAGVVGGLSCEECARLLGKKADDFTDGELQIFLGGVELCTVALH